MGEGTYVVNYGKEIDKLNSRINRLELILEYKMIAPEEIVNERSNNKED